MRQVLERLVGKLLRPEIDRLRYRLAPGRVLENPFLSAKRLSPLEGDKGYFVIPNVTRAPSGDLPVPPRRLRHGYDVDEDYLASGREQVSNMLAILRAAGVNPDALGRVLELGCAAARMLRFFPLPPGQSERWGVDVNAEAINWCQQNLSPPLLFAATTTFPHLPFEDNYFDMVFAGSVFTHIADLPDAWFLELRRVLRRGGYAYITIQDRHSIELILTEYKDVTGLKWFIDLLRKFDAETGALSADFECFSFEGGDWDGFPVPHLFHDVKYLARKWAPIADLVSVNEEAYGWQTGLLFQKR